MNKIPDHIKRFFVKDNKIPIHLFGDEEFNYLLDLYEPWIGSRSKFNELLGHQSKFSNLEKWESEQSNIREKLKAELRSSSVYKVLNDDFEELEAQYEIPQHNLKTVNVFNAHYAKKTLISIDMVKANWQVWKILGLEHKGSYEDWIMKSGGSSYMASAKLLRQSLFGEIQPKRVQRVQKSLSLKASLAIQAQNIQVITWSADELVVECPSDKESDVQEMVKKIHKILIQETPQIEWRMQRWELDIIDKTNDWIMQTVYPNMIDKEGKLNFDFDVSDLKYDFRNVPKYLLPQVYKKWINEPLIDLDLTFENDGMLAKYIKPFDLKWEPKNLIEKKGNLNLKTMKIK